MIMLTLGELLAFRDAADSPLLVETRPGYYLVCTTTLGTGELRSEVNMDTTDAETLIARAAIWNVPL